MGTYYFAGYNSHHSQRYGIVGWSERQESFLVRVFEWPSDAHAYRNPDLSVAFLGFQDTFGRHDYTPGPPLKTIDKVRAALEPYASLPTEIVKGLEQDRQGMTPESQLPPAIAKAIAGGAQLGERQDIYDGKGIVQVFNFANLPGTYVINDTGLYRSEESDAWLRAGLLFNHNLRLTPIAEIPLAGVSIYDGPEWMNPRFAYLLDELHSRSTPRGNTEFSQVWNEPSQRALEWAIENDWSGSEFGRSNMYQVLGLFGKAISLRQLRLIQKLVTLHEKIEAGEPVSDEVYDLTRNRYSLPSARQVGGSARDWTYRGPQASREELLGALQAIYDIADRRLETDTVTSETASDLMSRAGRALAAADDETKFRNQEVVTALSRIHGAYRNAVVVDQGVLIEGERLVSWEEQVKSMGNTAFNVLDDLDRNAALREIDLESRGWDRGLSDLVRSIPEKGSNVLRDALVERGALIEEQYRNPDTGRVVIQFENAPGTYLFGYDGASHTPLGFVDALRAMKGVDGGRLDHKWRPVESVETEFDRSDDVYKVGGHGDGRYVRIWWSEALRVFEVGAYRPSFEMVYRRTADGEGWEHGPDEYFWGSRSGDVGPLKTVEALRAAVAPYAAISDHTARRLEAHRLAREQGVEPDQRVDTSRDLLTGGLVSSIRQIADLRANDQEGTRLWSSLYHESAEIAADAVNSYAVKTSILDALGDGKLHSTVEIVKSLTGSGAFEKDEVHRAFLELADSYVIAPQRHGHPDNPVHGDISLMPLNEQGRYYIGAALRSGLALPPAPDRDRTLVETLQNITRIEALTPDGSSWKERVLKTEELANGALDPIRNQDQRVNLTRLREQAEQLKEGIGNNNPSQVQGQDSSKVRSIDPDDGGHSFSM
ncbi:MAG TPA: hypothetical protein VJ302_36900 [Blastocatellia bacterium]|nr:hypothetical protein [Blastocatellia bacterium]